MHLRYSATAFFALLAFASPARAYISLDAIVPSSPLAGETVSARLSDGICDAIIEADGYPQITQTGNSIRMLIETIHSDDQDFCTSLPGTVDLPFGAFTAGAYTLQVDRHYVDFIGLDVIETVGTASFVVGGASEAAPLPTLGSWGLFVLGLGVLTLAAFMRKQRDMS